MNQPDLGLKITELRQQKGFTQEKLAEYCESARTISASRGRSGATPSHATAETSMNLISAGKQNNQSLWLALLHMSSVVCIVFIPLVLWSWKKDQSYKIDQQGREVLNFQITIMLVLFAVALLLIITPSVFLMVQGLDREPGAFLGNLFTIVPPIPILLIGLFTTYHIEHGRASEKPIHYALSIPFVR
jgi:uncharacterized Tic20 family protein